MTMGPRGIKSPAPVDHTGTPARTVDNDLKAQMSLAGRPMQGTVRHRGAEITLTQMCDLTPQPLPKSMSGGRPQRRLESKGRLTT